MRQPPLVFHNTKVFQSSTQKHVDLILNNKVSFEEYLTTMGAKVSKIIALPRKLQHILLRQASITINNAFISPYLDYRDIFYD